MDLRTIMAPVQNDLDRFESDFKTMFQSNVEVIDRIADHLLRTKGKRLRPVLVLLSASAFGRPDREVIRTAAIVELIHTATLVHDDVVDEAALRRGLPSLNSIWDNHISVLMGDYLLSKALTLIVMMESQEMMRLISLCTERLSRGELLQATRGFDTDISESEYFQIIDYKTASLVASGCQVGAFLTSGSHEMAERFRRYGEALGIAFQITDDLLDFIGDEVKVGKPTGHDIREGTVTLPLIHAFREAPPPEATRMMERLDGDWDESSWPEVVRFTETYGGIAYARRTAQKYAEMAKENLSALEDSPVKRSLMGLVDYAIDRDH